LARLENRAGWEAAGLQTLKRVFTVPFASAFPGKRWMFPAELPAALPVVIPDFGRLYAAGEGSSVPYALPPPEKLLFFDLETTGLSGGAGTVAFLAAFGRLAPRASAHELRITQYLLLDYPGEYDFLAALLAEFAFPDQLVVSYNGKSFDSQILKTRCLMNGIPPPQYHHADLLHPCRRLWKRVLADCSQGTIETEVLGIDRSGDTPGSLAPEIWFSFLKTGDASELMGICDHNSRDIAGLAAIFASLVRIASEPVAQAGVFRYDIENLVLRWRDFTRRQAGQDLTAGGELADTGNAILRAAAEQGCPRASFALARDCMRNGDYDAGRRLLLRITESEAPETVRAAAFWALSCDSERRLACPREALALVKTGMALLAEGSARCREFARRAERLERKL
jgi:uncharacterized protein YprB with RNaseH-like and TPR domain